MSKFAAAITMLMTKADMQENKTMSMTTLVIVRFPMALTHPLCKPRLNLDQKVMAAVPIWCTHWQIRSRSMDGAITYQPRLRRARKPSQGVPIGLADPSRNQHVNETEIPERANRRRTI
jgi:hypothetical protein